MRNRQFLLAKGFFILLVFASHACLAKKSKSDSLFIAFKKDIQAELEEHKGGVFWDDETVESYCVMMIQCPVKDLLKHIDDSIPAIRCIMFSGLAQRGADEKTLRKIANRHAYDTASYTLSPRHLTTVWTVSSYMKFTLKYIKSENNLPHPDFENRLKNIRTEQEQRLVFVPNTYHSTIPKDLLLKADSILCSKSGIKAKSLSLTTKDSTIESTNAIKPEARNFISSLKVGDRIFIEDIVVELPDKTWRKVNPIVIRLK